MDERDIIDALNQAQDDEMVRQLMAMAGRDWLAERGFTLLVAEAGDDDRDV